MRLLVIEDDRDAADYLVKAFREVGHIADAANDGDDGLAMALDGEYDVLIVSWQPSSSPCPNAFVPTAT